MKIILPLYQTAKAKFDSLTLNSIYFHIRNPQECHTLIFRYFLYDLQSSGIFSYLHENNLYFIFQLPSINLLEELKKQVNIFVTRYAKCFSKDFIKSIQQGQTSENPATFIKKANLHPSKLDKDFIILRFILYRYLSKVYSFKKYIKAGGLVIYVDRFPKDERKFIFEDKFILQGIIGLFEVTPRGRGRIWFDIVTHVFKINELGGVRGLSHFEMKQESKEFYKRYLSLALMKPRDRYNKLVEMLNVLGIDDKIDFRFYIWDNINNRFKEYNIIFQKYMPPSTT